MTVTVPAYAKINLFLDIDSLRDDGYHNILSIMQSVSLHDDITVSHSDSEEKNITVFCNNSNIPCDKTNLVYKAADIFPVNGNIVVKIEKRIPVSAGLAGGSADAAATLIALNQICGDKLSTSELCALGARLGADVPFCIKKGACFVEGIGEKLKPVGSMPHFPIVIAKKGDGMSTPAAYKALDMKFDNFTDYKPNTERCDMLFDSDNRLNAKKFCVGLFNVFETVVEPERPAVSELKDIMLSSNAAGAMMSGSGTSVFGIFDDEISAREALAALKSCGAEAHLCYPL